MQTANASSYIHEFAHTMLENVLRWGKDSQLVRDWLGIGEIQEHPTAELHEKFAETFEHYMFEGKAPNKGVEGLFARLKAQMISAYRLFRLQRIFDRHLEIRPGPLESKKSRNRDRHFGG